ncbi:zinc finger protein 615-like [Leguminivora glycinivorella]|uniref:zinc finger protein 615-like n=1 Tax=Leguminivora glycinivorella TaxID=1035111 RepID=UPI00200DB7D3|nr:zinc finger protein 615-like [Leguminivora glycinivorella]
MLKCAHCDKKFKYESERKRHQESHFPKFSCTVCEKKFSFLSALRRHQKQHERKGSVRCNDCGGSFRDEALLKRHMKYAHKGSYGCPSCAATFSSEQALRTHSKTHQPESERRFRCMFAGCKKKFNFPHHLKHHELTHTNAKQHFCNVCEKGFIQSHHLKTHIKTHHPENWLQCLIPDCKSRFTTKHALKKHMSTHNRYVDVNCTDTKLDSGISSDSSVTNDAHGKNYTDDVTCVTCGKMISRLYYLHHTLNCTAAPQELTRRNDFEDVFIHHRDPQPNSPDSTYNQVTSGTYAYIAKEGINETLNNNSATGLAINFVPNDIDKTKTGCSGCGCVDGPAAPLRTADKTTLKLHTSKLSNMPELEYRRDGIIKIKETFDADIIMVNKVPTIKEFNEKIEPIDLRDVPYNSCKAVLGNCIVSDDGSVGEGCLCAKMLVDEQVSSQEIEELTPNPRAIWV